MVTLIFSTIIFFVATNIDDIFLLMTWFSQAKTTEQKRFIVAGQYLGFILLLTISIIGAFGALLIPKAWIGILGLIPIFIGIQSLVSLCQMRKDKSNRFVWLLKTASVTFVNGVDNIGVYIPFFSANSLRNIILIMVILLALVAVLCYLGNALVHQPLIAQTLERKGHIIVPFVLIGLGTFILIKHDTFRYVFNF
ncbi:cadmium resistance transporter [Bacillus sp. FJAT-49705]|uniref:Cadmium resistance transporter n=1 Tax=Cytobacillus citreus TaxID=2833586 RepID=A0ABS5NRR7_9BACI|nr:cadmium resistance transporter [Cytobacillus citreus]MBS4190512.1 cadmium resistance transporter [Cytobacillus citreus]